MARLLLVLIVNGSEFHKAGAARAKARSPSVELSNCIEHQFAHDLPQFSMLASISVDENEITLGFKQRSNVRDVAIEHLHVCIGQNQGIKSILFRSLECF